MKHTILEVKIEINIVNIDRKKLIKFLEGLVLKRYTTKEDIEIEIDSKTNLKLKLEQKSRDEFEEKLDYCFVSNIEIYGKDYCHIDIYYLVDNGGKILVTEVGYDFNC